MANAWPQERREMAAELIRARQPWLKSTGPRTPEGKARSSRNAWKGGVRPMLRSLALCLREQQEWLEAA
jgi:hypothetical protein